MVKHIRLLVNWPNLHLLAAVRNFFTDGGIRKLNQWFFNLVFAKCNSLIHIAPIPVEILRNLFKLIFI